MFLHDVIKIMYINMGYLPGHPFHLISDAEMFDAFLSDGGFFDTYYPCPSYKFEQAYTDLKNRIVNDINKYLEDGTAIQNWIYSYMLLQTITYQSPEDDIAYLCQMGNIESPSSEFEFNDDVAEMCYEVSTKWIQKLPSKYKDRPATMFGEPHVIKSLRLDEVNVLMD